MKGQRRFVIVEPEPEGSGFQYDAFVAYPDTPLDATLAGHLMKSLTSYRAPHSPSVPNQRHSLGAVYLDAGSEAPDREDEALAALERTRFLIVICSPRTPSSGRLQRQIERFRGLGRQDQILALLIEGEPEVAFPSSLRERRRTTVDGSGRTVEVVEEVEPLAADIRASSVRASLRLLKIERLRLIAPILGCSFDDLRQRQRERMVRFWSLVAAAGITASSLFSGFSFVQWRNAVEQERIAAEQQRRAEEAYARLTQQLPERFKDVPEALPLIKKALEENADTLERIQREGDNPMKALDDLLVQSSLAPRDADELSRSPRVPAAGLP